MEEGLQSGRPGLELEMAVQLKEMGVAALPKVPNDTQSATKYEKN